jgi:hypothetical protein
MIDVVRWLHLPYFYPGLQQSLPRFCNARGQLDERRIEASLHGRVMMHRRRRAVEIIQINVIERDPGGFYSA